MDQQKSNGKKQRHVRKKNAEKSQRLRKLTAVWMVVAAVGIAAVGGGIFWAFQAGKETSQTAQIETAVSEEQQETETADSVVTKQEETETETEEPEVLVELTEENRKNFVKVESCEIRKDSGSFVLQAAVEQKPASDDDSFYLLEMKTYETELNQERDYIASVSKDTSFSLTASVNENRVNSRLYSKFVVAVKLNGEYVALCEPQYITNPEALAAYRASYPVRTSIKGILVDPLKLTGTELDDLGVQHAAYNIPIANILGETTNANYPSIYYTYNGRTYVFNGQRIAEYDHVFSTLTGKNITITAILLNNKSSAHPQLIHPLSRNGSAYYYAFNAAEEDGVETLAAVGAFLAQRYRDSEHGTVMNWIVGNEVNVRSDWNYMDYVDIDTYAREYANAVRVFYNSIKSMNANARIYISMDQQWNRDLKTNNSYDTRDLLDSFNAIVSAEGNIDWGLAHHPYAYPLDNTTFWNSSRKIMSLITDSQDTSIVTMQNIHVVTDYLQQEELLTADGEVRPVILSELGYTSLDGETNQAAAFVYAYYAADSNPYIDALLLSRQTDAPEEIAQGLALGLSTQGGQRKYIYEIFKNIDKPGSEVYTEFAKNVIGISSWSEITGG